ncbi:MAG: hypothetical protein K0S12_513 [Bacteroidetes bacterium]|jgi:hypothetical protein|nr:hypothetical protein [Bacteroidota bacterium]
MEEENGSIKENVQELKKDVEDYIENRIDIIKLKAIEKTGSIASGAIVGIAVAFLGFFLLLFLSIAAGFAIGEMTERNSIGFLCVGVFYGLIAAVILIFKEKLVTFPIINSLLKKYYYK